MHKLLRSLHWLEDGLLVAVLLTTVLLAGIDIIARAVFESGVIWIPPTLRVLVLWLGLLGAMLATRTHEHIAVDVVGRLAPPRLRNLINAITTLFAAVICALLAWHSERFVELAYEMGDVAFARVPAWPLQIIIPVSFALMALRFFFQSGHSLFKFARREPV